jgi:zinc transport system substrate-binding protein
LEETMRHAIILTLPAFVLACGGGDAQPGTGESETGDPAVYTVNYPLRYFAERIGGDHVRVELPAPPEEDPAFWTPDAEAIAGYQSADLILLSGATYAKWLAVVSLPESRLVNTSQGFEDRYVHEETAVTHSHGPGGEHSHEGTAFTTWLDPTLAVEHARAIRDAFAERWPEHAAEFAAGFASLEGDLLELDRELAEIVTADPDRAFLASHPVYQYMARRYDLHLHPVQWEPGEAPTPAMWEDLRVLLRDHPASWMLWEGEPLAETGTRLRALGVEPIVFDPCGNAPSVGDYLRVMAENVERLRAAYR